MGDLLTAIHHPSPTPASALTTASPLRTIEQLLDRHGPALLLYARHWVDAATAEDVLQEALLRTWQNHASTRDPAAYAFACVRSAAIDRVRSEGSRRARQEAVASAAITDAFMPESGSGDCRNSLLAAVNTLAPDQREVVMLHVWGEQSFPAIAETLGQNVNTVAARWRTALDRLRSRLDPELL